MSAKPRSPFDVTIDPCLGGFNWEVSLSNGRIVACGWCQTEGEARAKAGAV